MAPRQTPAASRRKLIGRIIRIAVCAAAVSWIAYDMKWVDLREAFFTADPQLALLAIIVFGPVTVLISLRLKWLLSVNRIYLTFWQAVRVTFAGNFIIQSMPVGTSGGDAVKAFYIAKDTPRKHEAVVTVFFDRVVGVASLLGISGVVVLVNWHDESFRAWGRVIGITTIGLLVCGAMYFSYRVRKWVHMDDLVARLPMAAHLRRLDAAVFAYRGRPRILFGAFMLTVVLQGLSVITIWLAGWSLGLKGDDPFKALPLYLAYVPICLLAGGLPLGVMEAGFQALLADSARLGSPEAAVLLSIFSRLIQLIWAFPGIIVVLRAGRPPTEVLENGELSAESDTATHPSG